MEELLRQMEGRGPFAYDPSRDDTFQRYARLYQRQGQTAMAVSYTHLDVYKRQG